MGVSRLALAFNLGLILSGVSLIPASISLGLILPGLLAKLGMIAGIICSVALALVGFFPMNRIDPHGRAAMAYFRSGLLMMIFFNLAIALQQGNAQIIPKAYSLAGLPAILSFASFLILMGKSRKERAKNPLSLEDLERPKIWALAVVEWSIFITILIWFVVIAIGL